jgi:hypothetical protein
MIAGTIKRLRAYVNVMFPPGRMLATGAAFFLSVYLGLQAVAGAVPIQLGWPAAVGIVSTVLWMLLVRLNDDIADMEVDRKLAAAGDPTYQGRPTVTGAVRHSDLRLLSAAALAAFLALNVTLGLSVALAACVFGWFVTWLGFRWFFIERWSRNPGPLAYLGRKGLTVLVAVYAAAVYVDQIGWALTRWTVPLLLAPCAGVACWEVGRKIRLPAEETAYATYSSVLGWRGATALTGSFVVASWIMLLPLAGAAEAGTAYAVLLSFAALLALGSCARLLLRPTRERTRLGPWMQLYGAVAHGGLAVALLLRHGTTLL